MLRARTPYPIGIPQPHEPRKVVLHTDEYASEAPRHTQIIEAPSSPKDVQIVIWPVQKQGHPRRQTNCTRLTWACPSQGSVRYGLHTTCRRSSLRNKILDGQLVSDTTEVSLRESGQHCACNVR